MSDSPQSTQLAGSTLAPAATQTLLSLKKHGDLSLGKEGAGGHWNATGQKAQGLMGILTLKTQMLSNGKKRLRWEGELGRRREKEEREKKDKMGIKLL